MNFKGVTMFHPTRAKVMSATMSVLLLMGCSSKEQEKPAASSKLASVSLQLQWVTQAQFSGYYVALDKGWYRQEGLDLTIKAGGPDLNPVDLVTAGISDFGTALLGDLTINIEKGKKVIGLGQIQQDNGILLLAKKKSGIRHPQDLKGKTVGVWLGSWEAQFNGLLYSAGIDPNKVNIVSQGWSMDPFIRGEIDVASAMIYNEYHVVLDKGLLPEQLNIINYADFGVAFPGDVLFTSLQRSRNNTEECLRMLRASIRGWQYAIAHPAEATDIVLKYDLSGIQTQKHQLWMINEMKKLVQPPGSRIGATDVEKFERMVQFLVSYNMIDHPLAVDDVFAMDIQYAALQ